MSIEVLEVGQPTLGELAETINREHGQVEQAGIAMIEHAILAGEALITAKKMCGEGNWLSWVAANFDATSYTAACYMRVAHQAEAVRSSGESTFSGAYLYLRQKGLPGPTPSGGRNGKGYPDEMRAEAERLRDEGMEYRGISTVLGVSRATARRWLDPEYNNRTLAHVAKHKAARRDEIAAERKAKRQEAEQREAQRIARAARAAGGSIAKAYALAESLQDAIGLAHAEAVDREAKEALSLAGAHYRRMRDQVVRALGVS